MLANEGDTEPARLLLASASPRRRELLASLRVPFEVMPSEVVEDTAPLQTESAEQFAVRLAWQKATAVASLNPEDLVLAADTIVVLDGRVLGKPADVNEAAVMLRALRGRQHKVITGVFIVQLSSGLQIATSDQTVVTFREYTDQEIAAYVATGDPLDKAGAYGVQSQSFHPAKDIEGCYFNVMGLPLCVVAQLLLRADMDIIVSGFTPPDSCRLADCSLLS